GRRRALRGHRGGGRYGAWTWTVAGGRKSTSRRAPDAGTFEAASEAASDVVSESAASSARLSARNASGGGASGRDDGAQAAAVAGVLEGGGDRHQLADVLDREDPDELVAARDGDRRAAGGAHALERLVEHDAGRHGGAVARDEGAD